MKKIFIIINVLVVFALAACQGADRPDDDRLRVIAAESFLADIAQQVAGDRLLVESLIPAGADPHTYEPIPADLVRISEADVVILNGAGFEAWLEPLLESAAGERGSGEQVVIEASAGLISRQVDEDHLDDVDAAIEDSDHLVDPHFWLDPVLTIRYVENIRDGLALADPEGAQSYAENAAAYISRLKELDAWIATQVATIPAERRLLVTNHESFGYFADRYGFRVAGSILPGVSSGAMPSAQQIVQLMETIQETGAPAIFLEAGAPPEMADQIAGQTGVAVVTGLYTHSLTGKDGPVPTYLDLMRHNTDLIVAVLR